MEYKKGHEERVSKYTTFVDPPEVLLAKKQGQIASDVSVYLTMFIDIRFYCLFFTLNHHFSSSSMLIQKSTSSKEAKAVSLHISHLDT